MTIIGMVAISNQQVYAPRDCPGCSAFKKLTTEFEKAVIAAWGDPDEISRLLDEYSADVKALSETPPPEPD